jgi:hypothetical protein
MITLASKSDRVCRLVLLAIRLSLTALPGRSDRGRRIGRHPQPGLWLKSLGSTLVQPESPVWYSGVRKALSGVSATGVTYGSFAFDILDTREGVG